MFICFPSLLKLTGNANDYEAYFRAYWINKLGGLENFERFLQDGVIENSGFKTQSAFVNVSDLTPATAGVTATSVASSKDSSGRVDSLRQEVAMPAVATPVVMQSAPFAGNVSDAASKIGSLKGGDVEVILYQNVSVGTGSRANNAWLQEVSDPISKATWDNYAMISPQMGKSLFDIDVFNQHDMDKY